MKYLSSSVRFKLYNRVYDELKKIVESDPSWNDRLTDPLLLRLAAVVLPQNEWQAILDSETRPMTHRTNGIAKLDDHGSEYYFYGYKAPFHPKDEL